jgi:hypothetical protein
MSPATTYRTEQDAILGRLQSNWSTTPIAWPWELYEPTGVAFIAPRVVRQEAFNTAYSAASKRIRHPGLLTIDVRTPLKDSNGNPSGGSTALGYADTLAGVFRNVSFDGITFRAPTVRPFGVDGPWYRVQVDCPFWRDSTHSN